MNKSKVGFVLPKNIDHYLATLSKLYAQEREAKLQEIIVNARIRIHEDWSRPSWEDNLYGHALYLIIPERLYLGIVQQRDAIQERIRNDLNKIHNVRGEYIDEVFLELEVSEEGDWRRESGLFVEHKKIVLPATENRIWAGGGYRVFLSHKAEVKKKVAKLKEELKIFGISAFVAHEDIHPTREWQSEIENALGSMDALVALMTEDFHDSFWTDQEVGFAFGRGIPIVSVKLGRDPYGFIGKFQALPGTWQSCSTDLAKIFIKYEKMVDAYIAAISDCGSFDNGNRLAELLPLIDKLTEQQVGKLIGAFNDNREVQGSFGFNGSRPTYYGDGLLHHLNRITGQTYKVVRNRIQVAA